MKSRSLALIIMILVAAGLTLAALVTAPAPASAQAPKSAADYVTQAQALANGGKLADAITLLQQGIKDYPQSSDVYAYLGLYVGRSAGQQGANYVEAGRLASESFAFLDKAVALNPDNVNAYLYRGIMAVNVPVFMGKTSSGITDLKKVIAAHDKTPASVPPPMLQTAYSMLAAGYEKGMDPVNARATNETIVKLFPGTDAAKAAEGKLAALAPAAKQEEPAVFAPKPGDPEAVAAVKAKIAAEPSNAALELDLARALVDAKRLDDAREVLHQYNKVNPSNLGSYKLLLNVVMGLAQEGYSDKTAKDTTRRTTLAFEAMSTAEKIVELDPKDLQARLQRGIMGISMPFFVGKHDQGVEDLQYVLKNTTVSADSAQALYWLGVAREREAMTYWSNVTTKYPGTEAARLSFEGMRPVVDQFDPGKAVKPVVSIDFVLGFRDQLAPQTAVWIEDASEAHVKTVYVSGFAGNIKGKQVTLPVWAATSKFAGCDAVTGASIDVGHHIVTWDCKGLDGKPVKPGKYTVKVEVCHWPTMKYQLAEAVVTVGGKENSGRVEEGNYINSLVATYYPK